MVEPFSWNDEERTLELLDQTLLPEGERWLTLRSAEEVAEAIEERASALPIPAGGIAVESADETVAFYGSEVAPLVGGVCTGPGIGWRCGPVRS